MKHNIVLLAGYPGTGKSYLMNMILEKYTTYQIISPDMYKEQMWDQYGFQNLQEKNQCIDKAWELYYQDMSFYMQHNKNLLSDYPFSDKQYHRIKEIAESNHYQVITIRLIANLDILYERQRLRDLDSTRHLGHIVGSYQKGMQLEMREEQPCMVDYDEFIKRCSTRGYGEFALGVCKELDVSDFKKVDYIGLLKWLEKQISA